MRKNGIIKILVGLVFVIAIAICGINIVSAVDHSLITVEGTSGNILVANNEINGLKVTPAILFFRTDDSITYKVTLSDPDKKPFKIKVSDDNENKYVTTSYEYDDGFNSDEKTVLIKLTYSDYVPLKLGLEDIHITIDIDDDASLPNTGFMTDATKYLKATPAMGDQILANVIILYCLGATILMIRLLTRKRPMRFDGLTAAVLVGLAFISFSSFSAHAESGKIEITIYGRNISAIPDFENPQNVVSAVFPNIWADWDEYAKKNYGAGNSIILKTMDDKYVLMDTGQKQDKHAEHTKDAIYNSFKELQKSDDVVIDYLIISHLDGDHFGNAVDIINDEKITVSNVVLKYESKKNVYAEQIINAAINNNTHIITGGSSLAYAYMDNLVGEGNYGKISEGMAIEVGEYLKLDFFNTSDVYVGRECVDGAGINWWATNSPQPSETYYYYKTADDKYVYIDGSEYQTKEGEYFDFHSIKYPYANVPIRTTDTFIKKGEGNGSGMDRYFYAVIDNSRSSCKSNVNSFGILAEIETTNLKKTYMYFTGDIENGGYGMLSNGANSSKIYENLTFEDGEFKTDITPYVIPSEDNTAVAVRNKLANDAAALGVSTNALLSNIVVYQLSHHGYNNSEGAIQALGLNRSSGVYAIIENSRDISTMVGINMAKTYYYTLGNIPVANKLWAGDPEKDGVVCTVSVFEKTDCVYRQKNTE